MRLSRHLVSLYQPRNITRRLSTCTNISQCQSGATFDVALEWSPCHIYIRYAHTSPPLCECHFGVDRIPCRTCINTSTTSLVCECNFRVDRIPCRTHKNTSTTSLACEYNFRVDRIPYKTHGKNVHTLPLLGSNICVDRMPCSTHGTNVLTLPLLSGSNVHVDSIPYKTHVRSLHASASLCGTKDYKDRKREQQRVTDSKQGSEKARSTAQSVKISLIGPEGLLTVTTVEEAQRLAERRSLRLVRHEDKVLENKFQRQVYKLATNKEYFESTGADKKKTSGSYIKGETHVEVSHRISDNDLQTKIKVSMIRNLKKTKQIRLSIIGSDNTQKRLEEIMSIVQEGVASVGGKVQQVQKKAKDIKCVINPPRPEKKKDTTETDEAASDTEAD